MRGNARILTVLLCLTLILGLCGCSCRHEWVDATCTEPKTCAKCGETQGEALGHTPGEWQQDEPDYVTSVIWLRQYCTVCGAEVDVDMKALSSYCQDGTLLLSPEEFAERLDNLFGTLANRYGADCDFSAKIMSAEEDSMGCVVANAKGELLLRRIIHHEDRQLHHRSGQPEDRKDRGGLYHSGFPGDRQRPFCHDAGRRSRAGSQQCQGGGGEIPGRSL